MDKPIREKKFSKYAGITIVFSMIMMSVCVIMKIDITNVLVPILIEQQGWLRGDIMGAVTIGSYFAIAIGFIGGTIAMKKGIRNISLTGQAMMAVGTIMMALCKSLIGISFAFAICQAAYPLLILSAVTYVTKWYVKRRGWALGVATIALPLTSSFYLPLGNSVIAADGKTIFYLVVFVVIIAMAIFNVIVIRENPENRNVSPDGIPLSEDEKARIQETSQKTGILTFKFILSRKEGWLLIAANTMLRFGMVCLMSVLILRMTDIGLERAAAANIMAIATIIGIPFSYFWGLLDDKIGTNKACTLFGITYVIGFFLVLIMNVDNKYLIFFVAAYVASTSGGQQNLMQSIVSFVFGRKYFIQANRFVSLFADTGSAFAFTFMMTMYAKFQSYNQAYIVLIIISLVMTILYSQIKKTFDAERIELIDKKAPKTE